MPEPTLPAPVELRALVCHLLHGTVGKGEAHWGERMGEMAAANLTFSPTTNWALAAKRGTAAEKAAIGKAVDVVRQAHPYVRW